MFLLVSFVVHTGKVVMKITLIKTENITSKTQLPAAKDEIQLVQ